MKSFSTKIVSILSIVLLFCSLQNMQGQEMKYSDVHMHSPVDIPLYLSGTFGELRNNHFHSGLDIKTEGKVGLPVYAAEDGYVSRIKVSPNGYGKALYITHPNGYVTVYGHLQKFNRLIGDYVKKVQYQNESFSIQKYPKKDELTVKKGEVIAWSGNTGGSSGPHLHFEIREASSQHPVNPLFFDGIFIKDEYKPKILELAIYPVDKHSRINGVNDTVFYMVSGSGLNHFLKKNINIKVSGTVSFGLRSYDPMNDISNKNGIYSLEMEIDTISVFKVEMDKLSFATTRYMNSLIDYHYFKKQKRRMIRTEVDTNNRLFNYRDVLSNGIYTFDDDKKHHIAYRVKDVYGNTSVLKFEVQSEKISISNEVVDSLINKGVFFNFRKKNEYSADHISLSFPANAFYRSFYFRFDTAAVADNAYSLLYKIHNRFTPVQKNYTISITPENFPDHIKNKLFIALVKDNDEWYIGGDWEGDELITSTRIFGNYMVMADTIPPQIIPGNVYDEKRIMVQKNLTVEIKDKETGIGSFRGTLNGEWILMEYDPKQASLTYEIDERLKPGKNKFKVVVKDMLENETTFEVILYR